MKNKDINSWLKKNIKKKVSDEDEYKVKEEEEFGESLKYLTKLKTWDDVKKAYRKTAKVYSTGAISTRQVKTIICILNSYAEIIEKKELDKLKDDFDELYENYKILQEALKNDQD